MLRPSKLFLHDDAAAADDAELAALREENLKKAAEEYSNHPDRLEAARAAIETEHEESHALRAALRQQALRQGVWSSCNLQPQDLNATSQEHGQDPCVHLKHATSETALEVETEDPMPSLEPLQLSEDSEHEDGVEDLLEKLEQEGVVAIQDQELLDELLEIAERRKLRTKRNAKRIEDYDSQLTMEQRIVEQRRRAELLDPGMYDRAATVLQSRWRGGLVREQRRALVAMVIV